MDYEGAQESIQEFWTLVDPLDCSGRPCLLLKVPRNPCWFLHQCFPPSEESPQSPSAAWLVIRGNYYVNNGGA